MLHAGPLIQSGVTAGVLTSSDLQVDRKLYVQPLQHICYLPIVQTLCYSSDVAVQKNRVSCHTLEGCVDFYGFSACNVRPAYVWGVSQL